MTREHTRKKRLDTKAVQVRLTEAEYATIVRIAEAEERFFGTVARRVMRIGFAALAAQEAKTAGTTGPAA